MSNVLDFSGSNYITAPTLGDLSSSKLKVVCQNVTLDGQDGYLWSQAASNNREAGLLLQSGNVRLYDSGTVNTLGSVEEIFGAATITNGHIEVEQNYTTSEYIIKYNGVVRGSGVLNSGGARTDGALFRIGARGTTDVPGETSGGFIMPSGNSVGNVDVYIDDIKVREYVMPATGLTVPESVSSQDGALQSGAVSDWSASGQLDISPLDSYPIYAIGEDGYLKMPLHGLYVTGDTVVLEYKLAQSGVDITGWLPITDYESGLYSITPPSLSGSDTQYEIQTRVTKNSVTTLSTEYSFYVGVVVAWAGSSSTSRPFTDGSATSEGVLLIKDSGVWTEYGQEVVTGESAVVLANAINSRMAVAVGMYNTGVSGSRLLLDWAPGFPDYEALVSEVLDGNVSAFITAVGYNDAANGATIVQSDVQDFYNNLRSDISLSPIIEGASQRDLDNGSEAEFTSLFSAYEGAIAANNYAYPNWRLDLELEGVHLTQSGSNIVSERAAVVIDSIFGDEVYSQGPSVSQITKSGTTLTVALDDTDASYTNITPSTGIDNFQVLDDGVEVSISSTAFTAGDIEIELASAPTGEVTVGLGLWSGNTAGVNVLTNLNYPVADSSEPMPVIPFSSITAELPASITLTAPDTATEGAATESAGTGLDTITGLILKTDDDAYSISQTIDDQDATTIDSTAESGVNDLVTAGPAGNVNGIPLEPTISAAGITAYQLQQEVTDGVTTVARNITLNGESGYEVVQVMIASANTDDEQSVLGASYITVEDNMQFYAPDNANGMGITWYSDGTFDTDSDQTETIEVAYFSPASGEHSYLNLTIYESGIVPGDPPVITGPVAINKIELSPVEVNYIITNRNGELPTLTGTDAALFTIPLVSGDNFTLTKTTDGGAAGVSYDVTPNIDNLVDAPVTKDVTITMIEAGELSITQGGSIGLNIGIGL